MEAHKIRRLEDRINELRAELERVATGDDIGELLKIIHRPGWTTVAEGTLVAGLVESMLAQVKAIASMKQTLLAGSREVGVEAGAVR